MIEFPAVGFGCYNAKGGDNYQMIRDAIDSGYTLFDTASLYGTERALGAAIKDSGVDRDKLIIQSKVWLDELGREGVRAAIDRSLDRLQMDYLDVYLIHWPRQYPVSKNVPGHPEMKYVEREYEVKYDWKALQVETYAAMEELVDEGKIRAIGLSNFLPHHLNNILDNCRIAPIVDQLEVHIGYTQATAVSYAQSKGLTVQAWSPLGRESIIKEPFFIDMASKYGVSVSRLSLRFLYQMGIVSLPKSASPVRQKENLDILSFEISEEDFYTLACMMPVYWQLEHPDFVIPAIKSPKEQ